ncbi:glycosyltransferase family 2 protein, partial [Staphylococcus nepalensis]
MLISVILPVFNVEDYIEDCLDSILDQSIGEENIEVILIDDCSTDSSKEKILCYQTKFTNFKYHRLMKNQGSPGKPRNIGVEFSTGEFIHFMDPDDVLDVYAYETLLKEIRPSDDFIMGKMLSFNEDGSTFQHVTFREYKMNKTYINTNLMLTPFFAQVKVGVVLKLIRKSFYINNNIKFVENMRNGEDKLVDTLLYTKATSFSYIPFIVYYYRNRDVGENKSLTHQDVLDSINNDINAYYICYKNYNAEQ